MSRALRPSWTVYVVAAVLTVLGSCGAYWVLGSQPAGIDDAYITFVYGRHLEQGLGLVFIRGGEHVEGMTSLAWALASAAVLRVSAEPELPLLLVCATLLIFTIVNVHRVLRAVSGDLEHRRPLLVLALAAWAACQPGIYAWNVLSLMESSLWTFLVTAAAALCAESIAAGRTGGAWVNQLGLALCASAMALTRPESLALVPVMWTLATLCGAPAIGLRAAMRRYVPSLAAFLLVSGALVAFRMSYFGYPYPNTYYAKRVPHLAYSLLKGANYAGRFLLLRPWNGLALAVLILDSVSCLKRVRADSSDAAGRAQLFVSGTVLSCLGIPFLTSGDAFGEFRFYQPIVLLLITPTVHWVFERTRSSEAWWPFARRPAQIGVGLTALVLIGAAWFAFAASSQLEGEFRAATSGQRVGLALTHTLKPSVPEPPTLGVIGAGGTAWAYEGPVLDLLGLNWTQMAHSNADRRGIRTGHGAFSAEVFWSRPPELLVLGLQNGATCGPVTRRSALDNQMVKQYLRGLTETPRFNAHYEAGCLGQGSDGVAGFYSREWLRNQPALSYHPLIDG